jgi:PAS domain S-box-containing protein
MDDPAQTLNRLLTEHATQQQCIFALEARVGELEALVTGEQRISDALRESLEELGIVENELRQELAEREAVQQAVETERQQYHTLFALAPDGYLVTNTIGLIHDANPTAARLLGMPQTLLLGKPLLGFLAPEELQRFQTLLHALRREPPPGQAWVGRFHPTYGQPFMGELTVAVRQVMPAPGHWYHWLLRDITVRVETEAALRQAMAERARLEREAQQAAHFALLGRLAAGVSHELCNPLAAVMLHVDLLREELLAPSPDSQAQMLDALTAIQTHLARVDDLLQDYLVLVRGATPDLTPHDFGVTVQAWAQEWQPLAAARGVTFRLAGVEGLGVVAMHEHTLHRAALNLVQNALEAMPQGGTLTLTGARTADAVQLQIQDTGHGIPVDALSHIFEPLYTTKPGGTGLGLYLVQEILIAHEGHVTVASVEGQGTTVTLMLPVTPADSAQVQACGME